MCTGSSIAVFAASEMENLEFEVSTTRELEVYDCGYDKPMELATPSAVDLTPGRRDLMRKYLSLKENEPWPLLAEYFGVALAFAALGALIRGLNGSKGTAAQVKFSLKLQRIALQAMLKGAMERLQCLAQNAEDLKLSLKESVDARNEDRKAWDIERTNLLQKIADAKTEVAEMKRRRGEDAKANEKVVQIYASQEQSWRTERKKLRHEIDLLRKDLLRKEIGGLFNPRSTPGRTRCCEECKVKAKHLKELEETLSEKEFLMMTAMEDAQSEEYERNELAEKLVKAEAIATELRGKIAIEDSNRMQQQAFIAEIAAKQRETERQLETVLESLENAKADIAVVTENHAATVEKLSHDLATLQEDLDDKEEVIRVMLRRASVEREEREALARELSQSTTLRKQREGEKERWKRLAEERARMNSISSSGKDAAHITTTRHSLGSRTELDKLVELQKVHAQELQNMRSVCSRQIEGLESQVELYKAKVLELEQVTEVQHATDVEHQERKQEKQCPRGLAGLPEPVESSTPPCSSWKVLDFQESTKDPAAFKEWLEVVKGWHAAQLKEQHRHEVEAFERQMRVKDEKIGAFRSQLMAMESETMKLKSELEELKGSRLMITTEDDLRSEVDTVEKKDDTSLSTNQCARSLDVDFGCNVVVTTDISADVKPEQDIVQLLHLDIDTPMEKLEDTEVEHQANLLKVGENAEAELRQKDSQLAVVETELWQVQKCSEARISGSEAAAGICHEKVIMKENNDNQDDQEPPFKMVTNPGCSGGLNQIQPEDDRVNKAEEIVYQAAVAFDNKPLLKIQESVAEEEKAMVLSQPDVALQATNDCLHSQEHTILSGEQETTGNVLQANDCLEKVGKKNASLSEIFHTEPIEKQPKTLSSLDEQTITTIDLHDCLEKVGKKNASLSEIFHTEPIEKQPKTLSSLDEQTITTIDLHDCLEKVGKKNASLSEIFHTEPIEKQPKTLSSLDDQTITTIDLHNKGEKSLTKQTSSPVQASDHVPAFRTKWYSRLGQASYIQSLKPTRNLFQAVEKKKSLDKHRPQLNLSKDGQTPLSPRSKGALIIRKDSRTREEIQLLGLALEVRRIEQQLAVINKVPSTCKTEVDAMPFEAQDTLQTKAMASRKQTKRYAALTGKVSQLAKQIGLMSADQTLEATASSAEQQSLSTTGLCLHKNPLFTQEPSSLEFILLQQRAEAVSENLAAIQAKIAKENDTNILAKDTSVPLISKEQLVDSVRAHLSQVQQALSLKLSFTVPGPEEIPSPDEDLQVHAGWFQEDLKGVAGFDRRDSRASKYEDYSKSEKGKQARAILLRQKSTTELQR